MDRIRSETVRRAGDERRFTNALKRQHVAHLSGDEAAQLARNMDVMLSKRKAQLGRQLPAHMVPSTILRLEELPTLPNGMVDYDALPFGKTLLGYIVGGIVTPENQRNPFVANTIGITSASMAM